MDSRFRANSVAAKSWSSFRGHSARRSLYSTVSVLDVKLENLNISTAEITPTGNTTGDLSRRLAYQKKRERTNPSTRPWCCEERGCRVTWAFSPNPRPLIPIPTQQHARRAHCRHANRAPSRGWCEPASAWPFLLFCPHFIYAHPTPSSCPHPRPAAFPHPPSSVSGSLIRRRKP
jgi:hypothetical protein